MSDRKTVGEPRIIAVFSFDPDGEAARIGGSFAETTLNRQASQRRNYGSPPYVGRWQ